MSNTETTRESSGNGEAASNKQPYGLKSLASILSPREQVALGFMQSLLRAENPKMRKNKAKQIAQEAFDLADVFLEIARKE